MRERASEKRSFLDKPLVEVLNLDWEKALYLLFVVVAAITRFWDLGARGMSHDESLHALYSWKLYAGQGYQHNPMMHGPFLFHANALAYFLFGVSDYTARIVPALFGTVLVLLPYFLRRWLGRTGALITSFLLLISPSFLYYSRYIRNDIYIAVWNLLLIIGLFHYLEERREVWLYLMAGVLSLSLATKEVAYITGFIGVTFVLATVVWELVDERRARSLKLVGWGVVVLLIALAWALAGKKAAPEATGAGSHKLLSYITLATGCLMAAVMLGHLVKHRGHSPTLEAFRQVKLRTWGVCVVIFVVIFVLLFTTFLTNPYGLITGAVGSITYWLAQHGVQRGNQPWYYYFVLLPLYEFLPLLFGLVGAWHYLTREKETTEESDSVPFVPFLIYWLITSVLIYSWAGEKMPWLILHPALPMIVLSGRFLGEVLERVDWREVCRRGGLVLGILLPPTLSSAFVLLTVRPFQGMSLQKLQQTGQWLGALLATVILVALVVHYWRRLGTRYSLYVILATFLVILCLLTIRFAWMASYINYDYANELLVYAHGTPDIKLTMREIEEISRQTVGDRAIKVAYDDDSTWPLEWYLQPWYPNRSYYASNPTREALDAPIVIMGSKNEAKVRPFLGTRYYCFKRRLIWWPPEEYKGMTLAKALQNLRDPANRADLWNIFFYRKFKRPFNDWYYRHEFYFCVRKDTAHQVWGYKAGPPEEEVVEPYAKGYRQVKSLLSWGGAGTAGGQFQSPRGMAVDKEGNIYVADSQNHRIQKFDPNGQFLLQWGSHGSGPGQFNEPWGLAVDDEGNVYVADTWNHRIQKFDPNGRFLTSWGMGLVDTQGKAEGFEGLFYGPRDIAIDPDGNLYVTDTGNKRIQKFDPEGKFLGQWGGYGTGPGQFNEPVGIAIDSEGNIYVADTWNQRVQKFDRNFNYLTSWPIHGWESQSVVNKPYIAVDERNRVYVTDPEGYRVIVFDADGTFLYTFGQYGSDASSFNLPIGVVVDEEGNVYVADSGNNRVMKFGPME